jgi:hypothetical protein
MSLEIIFIPVSEPRPVRMSLNNREKKTRLCIKLYTVFLARPGIQKKTDRSAQAFNRVRSKTGDIYLIPDRIMISLIQNRKKNVPVSA